MMAFFVSFTWSNVRLLFQMFCSIKQQGVSEYFLPQKFVLLNNKGELVADLLEDLKDA